MNLDSQYEFYIFQQFLIGVYYTLLLDQASLLHTVLLLDNLLLNLVNLLHTHLCFLLSNYFPTTFSHHRNNQKLNPYII